MQLPMGFFILRRYNMPSILPEQLLLIGFGAVIGALLSFIATELSALRQKKVSEAEKTKDETNKIIIDTCNFIFQSDDVLDNLISDKTLCEELEQKISEIGPKAEKERLEAKRAMVKAKLELLKECDNRTKIDFYNKFEFHSLQIKRLKDKAIWRNFELLKNSAYHCLYEIIKSDTPSKVEKLYIEYQKTQKDFLARAIEITKV
jgi:hypothetical protein